MRVGVMLGGGASEGGLVHGRRGGRESKGICTCKKRAIMHACIHPVPKGVAGVLVGCMWKGAVLLSSG